MAISQKRLWIGAIGIALLFGGILGWFLGRWVLFREWSNPLISWRDRKVLKVFPLKKGRMQAAALFENDEVKAKVVSFGHGDDGSELNIVFENRAPCTLIHIAGVAYAYDAEGRPVMLPKIKNSYEHRIYFEFDHLDMKAWSKGLASTLLGDTEEASIGYAQVDSYACKEGKLWHRSQGSL